MYYNSIFQDAVADKQTVSLMNTLKNCRKLLLGIKLGLINLKNDSFNTYFCHVILIFDKNNVTLQRHSLLCSLQGCTVCCTLHNVKASSMLCQLAVLNVRNSRLMVKDNVGSDCYWYAQKRTGVCIEGIIYPQHTFLRIRATYWRRQKLHSFTIKGYSHGLVHRTS